MSGVGAAAPASRAVDIVSSGINIRRTYIHEPRPDQRASEQTSKREDKQARKQASQRINDKEQASKRAHRCTIDSEQVRKWVNE